MTKRPTLLLLALLAPACGGGSLPSAATTPPVTAPPAVTATPAPVATPDPNCTTGLCEAPIVNTRAPIRVQLRLYQLFNPGGEWVLPTPDPTRGVFPQAFKVGQTLRLDATGRDANGDQTLGSGRLQWLYSDPTLFSETILSDGFQRKLRLERPGEFSVFVMFDGIGSNDLYFRVEP